MVKNTSCGFWPQRHVQRSGRSRQCTKCRQHNGCYGCIRLGHSGSGFTEALRVDHELSWLLYKVWWVVRHLVGRIEDLALRPVTARLAHFLLEQVENPTLAHSCRDARAHCQPSGYYPESISRSLRVLEEAGAIRFDRHRIIIIQPDTLRHQANL